MHEPLSLLRRTPPWLLAMLLCAGCAGSLDPAQRAQPLAPPQLGLSADAGAVTWPAQDWWKQLGDPQLDRLVEQALAGHPSLRIAEARVRQARQFELFVRADTDPTLAANAAVNRQRYSENYMYSSEIGGSTHTDARLALDFFYEFDFWGRQRSLRQAARKQVEAEQAELQSARLVLAVAVTQTYISWQRALAELKIAKADAEQRAAMMALHEKRAARGIGSRAAIEPHRAARANAEQTLNAGQQAVDTLRRRLAALTGQGPDALVDLAESKLEINAIAPSALPADLLGRRPDIVAQRLRIEAAGADIDAAAAEFYPNIDLTAFFGVQSLGLDDLLESGSRIYGAGPALHLPLFNRAALRANLGSRQADYDAAVAQYNQTLLDAVRDVADQGGALRSLQRQRAAADDALAALQRARDLSEVRLRRGIGTRIELLDAESALLAQQRVAADLRERELQAAVALIRALGGGYDAAAPADAAQGDSHG